MGGILRRRELILPSGGVDDKALFDQYILPGFWIDGIQNTPNGHDSSATRWFNHRSADPQKDFAYNANAIVTDKYCIPNGRTNYYEVGTTSWKNMPQMGDAYSIELVVEALSSDGGAQMVAANRANNYGTTWISADGDGVYFSAGSDNGGVGIKASPGVHTYVATGKGKTYYKDGLPISEDDVSVVSASWSTQYRAYLFYYSSNYPRPCKSKIYAMRWYARQLTAEEVAHNYALDRIRFGSGVS